MSLHGRECRRCPDLSSGGIACQAFQIRGEETARCAVDYPAHNVSFAKHYFRLRGRQGGVHVCLSRLCRLLKGLH